MSFCIVCFLHRFHRFQQINLGQQHRPNLLSDPSTELENSRKFSLNSLTALLAILAVSGSKALHPVALTLLIYTISLRLAVNTCFLHNYPTLSIFLHVIPLLGTSCMAGVELVSSVQSPALATVSILLGVLPLGTLAVHHGRQCTETLAVGLPVRMEHLPAPAVSGSVNTTIASD